MSTFNFSALYPSTLSTSNLPSLCDYDYTVDAAKPEPSLPSLDWLLKERQMIKARGEPHTPALDSKEARQKITENSVYGLTTFPSRK